MSIVVTENWSDRKYKPAESAQRGFIVTGVTSDIQAIQAVADFDNGCDVDDAYPGDDRLRAQPPTCEYEKGPRTWHVVFSFALAPGGSITPPEADPLKQPVKWSWADGTMTVPTDVDAKGNPIVNGAYFPMEGATQDIQFKILTGTRNQSKFDVPMSNAFENTVNNDSVTIPMAGTVSPGQLLCKSILPTHDYDINSRYVTVAYVFWLWGGRVKDGDGLYDSWKHRMLNASRTGWYDNSGTKTAGNFVAMSGSALNAPALLGTDGKPLNATIGVEKVQQTTPVAAVAPATLVKFDLFEVTTNASFLKYYKCLDRPFMGLTIF